MADARKKYIVKPIDFVDKVCDKYTKQYWKKDEEVTIDASRMQEIEDYEAKFPSYKLVEVIKTIPVKKEKHGNSKEKGKGSDSLSE